MRIATFSACALFMAMASTAIAEELDAERVSAARELIISVTADDRVLDMMEAIVAEQLPMQRQVTSQSPAFRGYTPEHQVALLSFLEQMPALVRTEFAAAMEPLADRVSGRIAHLMSAEHFIASANAFRAEENAFIVREAIAGAFARGMSDSAFPDLSRSEEGRRFLRSEAGMAFSRARAEMDRIIAEESTGLASLGSRMRMIGMAGACDALEEECPLSTRQQLGRP